MVKTIVIEKKGRKGEWQLLNPEKIEEVEEIEEVEGSTDSESSSSGGEEPNIIEKPKRRTTYTMTDARKQAFEKARQVRAANIAARKAEKDKEQEKYNQYKDELKQKKELKKKKQQEQELKQFESSSEEEIIVKKRTKPKKKIIYLEDDEEEKDDKKNVIIINNGPAKQEPPATPKKVGPRVVFC